MKKKWVVSYWDDAKDCLKKIGFDTYEEAVTCQYKVKNKYNRTARIEMRSKK